MKRIMTHEDLQQIKGLIHSEVGAILEDVLLPAMEKLIKSSVAQEVKKVMQDEMRLVIREEMREELKTIKGDIAYLKEDIAVLKTDVAELKKDVAYIKNNYPDKHYLDDRINELRGDIISWRKKDGARFDQLVAFQHKKGYVAEEEVQLLGDMRGFAPLPLAQ
ncbi:MAG: hypothetical protein A3H07_00905 [Candidatus Jacksonbacteria bacterium RIFCSPLOWO2_12_FULL_44_15b]|nr:MAG: hypothetical protein A3H07_00905 [Candidatus Jacksonbacteria bacterium RIFCSPLOWO2_12_FULL_44_15b]